MPQNMTPQLTGKFDDYHDKISAKAEDVVFRIFPEKILSLQEKIDGISDHSSPFNTSHIATSTDANVYAAPSRESNSEPKKRKLADQDGQAAGATAGNARYTEAVSTNKKITEVLAILKNECEELTRACDEVSIWVNLAMPTIEDGDNFGVGVQEEALAELTRCQQSAYNLRDTARQHHQSRAKICSKLIKYPNIEDYTLALKEHDEKILYTARSNLYDLRNLYAVLTNVFQKNISKIKAPKGNNSTGLY